MSPGTSSRAVPSPQLFRHASHARERWEYDGVTGHCLHATPRAVYSPPYRQPMCHIIKDDVRKIAPLSSLAPFLAFRATAHDSCHSSKKNEVNLHARGPLFFSSSGVMSISRDLPDSSGHRRVVLQVEARMTNFIAFFSQSRQFSSMRLITFDRQIFTLAPRAFRY